MLLAVVVSRFLARATRLPVPLVQIALGAAVFYSSLTSVELDPDVFFLLLLPPLLFLDDWRIPKDDLLREAPTIVTLALLRFIWVWASMTVAFFGVRSQDALPASARWRVVLAMSMAGVRGAITLAAVLTLPVKMIDGTPFPGRDLAIFLAAGVIVLSLVLATPGLPRALRGLDLPLDAAPFADEERARKAGAEAALRAVESAQDALPAGTEGADLRAQASARVAALYRIAQTGARDRSSRGALQRLKAKAPDCCSVSGRQARPVPSPKGPGDHGLQRPRTPPSAARRSFAPSHPK